MPPQSLIKERSWHQLFEFGVVLKAINGILETITGSVVFIFGPRAINYFLDWAARTELLEGPDSHLFHILSRLKNLSSSTETFLALYVLFHGLLNIFLAIGLYRNKLWTYLAAIFSMTVFAFYQIRRYAHTHSPILLTITLFDIFFMYVIWHEYKHKMKLKHAQEEKREQEEKAGE